MAVCTYIYNKIYSEARVNNCGTQKNANSICIEHVLRKCMDFLTLHARLINIKVQEADCTCVRSVYAIYTQIFSIKPERSSRVIRFPILDRLRGYMRTRNMPSPYFSSDIMLLHFKYQSKLIEGSDGKIRMKKLIEYSQIDILN